MDYILYPITFLAFPIILFGLINRTKAIWAGRKGFPILQLGYDLVRLARKKPVYSASTSWIFQVSGIIFFCTTIVAGLVSPILPGMSVISFQYDFVFFAYVLALGRIFLILGALDTASSFEGMGASREVTYSALIEPALFISLGSLCLLSNSSSMSSIATLGSEFGKNAPVILFCAAALFVLIQSELSRGPIDDPNTHLELTMIHEVMVLDHSAIDLALIQYASAIKLSILSALIAAVFNPFSMTDRPAFCVITSMLIMIGIAVGLGLVESLIARVRMKAIPVYLGLAVVSSAFALILTLLMRWNRG